MFDCKATCGQCTVLASHITASTNIPVEMVDTSGSCADADDSCAELKAQGLCERGRSMITLCKETCGFCVQPGSASAPSQNASTASALPSGSSRGSPAGGVCEDSIDLCPYFAQQLQLCDDSTAWWMHSQCKRSCQHCNQSATPNMQHITNVRKLEDTPPCVDYHPSCSTWSTQQKCGSNRAWMNEHCALSCGVCHAEAGAPTDLSLLRQGTDHTGAWTLAWMVENGPPPPPPPPLECLNKDPSCTGWATLGECVRNKAYMELSCRPACGFCSAGAVAAAPPPVLPVSVVTSASFWYFETPLAQIQLNNGVLMPMVGFGTAGLGDRTQQAVQEALAAGYRHIDSAQAREWYREDMNGAALAASAVPRKQLWLTTKIHPRYLGQTRTLMAFSSSLEELATPYMDLVLLHYSSCWGDLCTRPDPKLEGAGAGRQPAVVEDAGEQHTWRQSWRAFEELYEANKTRAIGVSNFGVAELKELFEQVARIKPQVVQVHMDPLKQSRDVLEYCRANGIQMVAYSTLGTQWGPVGKRQENPVLNHATLKEIARQVGRSVAQVVLRWALQLGVVVLPRSQNPVHMRESLALWDFTLSAEHMRMIQDLDGSLRAS